MNDRYVSPEGTVFRVITVHPPYITARRRRGWAVTLMNESEATMHLVSMSLLKEGGYTAYAAPAE